MLLTHWQNFYVIIGSAAGALVGLQFVVIALIANHRDRIDAEAVGAFGTPTVCHFVSALVLAAVMNVPMPNWTVLASVLLLGGVAGLLYVATVYRRALRQQDYVPVAEDWVWYVILPSVAYGLLALGGILMWVPYVATVGVFVVGLAALSLLLIGVHNAWDTVIHTILTRGSSSPPRSANDLVDSAGGMPVNPSRGIDAGKP